MKVVFRVDSSAQIGTGHLMRCLTLADALRDRGAECRFVCGEQAAHRMDLVQSRGFAVRALPMGDEGGAGRDEGEGAHDARLGRSWREDAKQTVAVMADSCPDWVIVDHYALDIRWERDLRRRTRSIMAIDDLADRSHDADLLLDQNLGREVQDYAGLVPDQCRLLIGPRYALLRPEFAQLRGYSLARRRRPHLKHFVVSMGGADASNASGQVLDAFAQLDLPPDCRITVVMGGKAPWLESVRIQAARCRWPCEVRVDVTEMAQLMSDCDLAIGAAGSAMWERCCLGVPSLLVMVAENQRMTAVQMEKAEAAFFIGEQGAIAERIGPWLDVLAKHPEKLTACSVAAAAICDGTGAARVATLMTGTKETLQ